MEIENCPACQQNILNQEAHYGYGCCLYEPSEDDDCAIMYHQLTTKQREKERILFQNELQEIKLEMKQIDMKAADTDLKIMKLKQRLKKIERTILLSWQQNICEKQKNKKTQ